MKISCIIHSLNGGGAERVMAGLASRLSHRGHDVTLITLDDGRKDKHEVDPRVKRVPLDVMGYSRSKLAALINNVRRCRSLRAAVLDSHADVVLSFCDVTNVLTLLAMRGLATPVLVSERSDPKQQSLLWPWSSLRPRLYRNAAEVIVLTRAAAKTVMPWSHRSPVIIPSAVDPPLALDRSHLMGRSQHVVIGIGRLEIEKGFDRLIAAFAEVASQYPQWQLRIVGEGSCRCQLEQQAAGLDLTNRIQFMGWIQPIWAALQDADLFALTSRYEGFPSALLEAMAAGVAVLAVDCESGPREIIRHDVDGILAANDDEALAAALARCMGDASLRLRLGNQATSVSSRFSWQRMTDAYEQCLRACADRAGT